MPNRCSWMCRTKIRSLIVSSPLWLIVCSSLCGCRATTPPFPADQHGPIASVVATDILDADQGDQGELSGTEIAAFSSLLEATRGRWKIGAIFLGRDYQLDILWTDGHSETLLIGLGAIVGDTAYASISDSEADSIFVHLKASIERRKKARAADAPAAKKD